MSMLRAAAAIALAVLAAQARAEGPEPVTPEPVTIDAFSVWSGSGSVIATSPDTHAFAGEMRGPYFVDAGQGPIPAGEMVCVGILEADQATGKQAGSARCQLIAFDGARAFGGFVCAGYRMVGCAGQFTLTGGDGRLAGATGQGPIVIRRYETALAAMGDGSVGEVALGVASWKGFTVTPAPAQ